MKYIPYLSSILAASFMLLETACLAPGDSSRNAGTSGKSPTNSSKTRRVKVNPGSNDVPSRGLQGAERRVILAEHNRTRHDVKMPPLLWSDELGAFAQEWADQLARTSCSLQHRPRSGRWKQRHGENLFMGTAGYYTVKSAAQGWESEKKDYRGGPIVMNNHFFKIGHYTQMIWRRTTHVGCAKSVCRGNLIVVCNYNPPGNMIGRTPFE